MMTKSDASTPVQANLFKVLLRDIVYPQQELIHGSAPDIAALDVVETVQRITRIRSVL